MSAIHCRRECLKTPQGRDNATAPGIFASGRKWSADKNSGFTLIELLAVILIIGLLVVLSYPTLRSAIAQAQSGACESNLHDIGIAVESYTAEQGTFPIWASSGSISFGTAANPSWVQLIIPYASGRFQYWVCPTSEGGEERQPMARQIYTNAYSNLAVASAYYQTIGINGAVSSLSPYNFLYGPAPRPASVRNLTTLIYAADCAGSSGAPAPVGPFWKQIGGNGSTWREFSRGLWPQTSTGIDPRHNGSANVLFADGHVERVTSSTLALWIQNAAGSNVKEPHWYVQY